MTFQEQLQKAREEYKRTGKMDSERACILLNCSLAVQEFKRLNLHKDIEKEGIEIIKEFEKDNSIGKSINPNQLCRMVYSILTKKCIYRGRYEYTKLFFQFMEWYIAKFPNEVVEWRYGNIFPNRIYKEYYKNKK